MSIRNDQVNRVVDEEFGNKGAKDVKFLDFDNQPSGINNPLPNPGTYTLKATDNKLVLGHANGLLELVDENGKAKVPVHPTAIPKSNNKASLYNSTAISEGFSSTQINDFSVSGNLNGPAAIDVTATGSATYNTNNENVTVGGSTVLESSADLSVSRYVKILVDETAGCTISYSNNSGSSYSAYTKGSVIDLGASSTTFRVKFTFSGSGVINSFAVLSSTTEPYAGYTPSAIANSDIPTIITNGSTFKVSLTNNSSVITIDDTSRWFLSTLQTVPTVITREDHLPILPNMVKNFLNFMDRKAVKTQNNFSPSNFTPSLNGNNIVYIRKISDNTFSIHPTLNDANNNTNAHQYTGTTIHLLNSWLLSAPSLPASSTYRLSLPSVSKITLSDFISNSSDVITDPSVAETYSANFELPDMRSLKSLDIDIGFSFNYYTQNQYASPNDKLTFILNSNDIANGVAFQNSETVKSDNTVLNNKQYISPSINPNLFTYTHDGPVNFNQTRILLKLRYNSVDNLIYCVH